MLADEDDSSLKERVEYEAKQLKLWDQFKQTERVHDSTTTTIEALVKRLVVAKESANSVSPDRKEAGTDSDVEVLEYQFSSICS